MAELKRLRPNGRVQPNGRVRPEGQKAQGMMVLRQVPFGGRPGDQRGFIHKKILGGISKIAGVLPIPGASIVSTVARTLAGGGRAPARPVLPPELTARTSTFGAQEKEAGQIAKGFGPAARHPFGNGSANGRSDCPSGFRPDFMTGRCEPAAGQEVGEAVMGRFGAALVPGIKQIDRAVCLRGMQLAIDGLCYNKSQISNKQRMWPAGRRPLLTGGDMRAIGIASRAAKRLEGTTKRLRSMGMIKALPKGRAQKALPAAHHHHPA